MSRLPFLLLAGLLAAGGSGCASVGAPTGNPVFVPERNPEAAWEKTVDALHDFKFPILRESKLDGVIETDYVVGSSVFEPWRRDSVGWDNRLESTFQSIRRKAFITLRQGQGGYFVSVEAYKEKEDLRAPAANTAGGATFQINQPLQRDLNLVVGQAAPSGWMALGRDYALEQAMLKRIRSQFP
jgi:hypothetical protein